MAIESKFKPGDEVKVSARFLARNLCREANIPTFGYIGTLQDPTIYGKVDCITTSNSNRKAELNPGEPLTCVKVVFSGLSGYPYSFSEDELEFAEPDKCIDSAYLKLAEQQWFEDIL